MDRQLISEEDTFLWLSKGDLKAETESELVAAQDEALNTKYHATKILHTDGQQMQTVPKTRDSRPYNISVPNIGKRTICKTA
jgi:hypothetical protein